jgi:flagellar motor protein MotB
MKYSFSILLSIFICSITITGLAQGFHTSSNKALKLYNDGLNAFDFMDLAKAESNFREAVSIDRNFLEAFIMLGDLYTKQRKFSEAAVNYQTAVKLDSLFFKPVFFTLANAEMMSGDYTKALIHYKVYLAQEGMSAKNRIFAGKNLLNCEFAIEAIKNPVPFNPISVGASINSPDDEYWPSITADGQTMMFTRQKTPGRQSTQAQLQEDFYVSSLSDNVWQKTFNAGAPLNTSQNEGAQTLSSNGDYMYFTACDRQGGFGSCDIFFSSFNDGKWSEPNNIGSPVNTKSWESQPSISADGKTLFFSSNRPGGFGGKDLWYSRLTDKNIWSKPVNMGERINSEGDEMSPFIHFDGKTLYFSSDGKKGMGGFDIYLSRMNDDSTWTEPQNLGYPINTYNDELGLIIEAAGQKAYFSSIRDKSNGKDIFFFNLYESARPNSVSYMKGKVFDKETGMMLRADYELINLSTGKTIAKNTTDVNGNFLVCLPSGYNYGINVNKAGYLFYSESFMFEGMHTVVKPYIKRINLNPIRVGGEMQLSNVFYETDSWELKKESVSELNILANLLAVNKNITIEIGGYTDSTGTSDYNKSLSEKRALSVVNYLISKGIKTERLKYKGYGITSPLGDNVTVEGRKLNRRTEVKVMAIGK